MLAPQLSVPGLRNLGNTCYLNAVLQALASCQALLEQLESALSLLTSALDGQAPSAGAPLVAALLHCLRSLQPQPSSAGLRTLVPHDVVDLLRSKTPPGVLQAGEEHDAAEAVEVLCSLVAAELQHSFLRAAQMPLTAQASLAAVLGQRGSTASQQQHDFSSSREAGSGGDAAVPAVGLTGAGDAGCLADGDLPNGITVFLRAGTPAAANDPATAAASLDLEAPAADSEVADTHPAADTPAAAIAHQGHRPDPVLRGWQQQARLALQGTNAHELQCLRCRHCSAVQLSPFWVLPLCIPAAPGRTLLGNVPAASGASVEGCLAAFYGYEAVSGVHCTRCSLLASLEVAGIEAVGSLGAKPQLDFTEQCTAAGSAGQPQAGSVGILCTAREPVGLRGLRQALEVGGWLAESEMYRERLTSAGLAWLPRPSPAAKRTVAAQLPRVLCLQLRRGFWSEHGHVKLTGHVHFPLRLALSPRVVPVLGHRIAASEDASPTEVPIYLLRAVVVHHGGLAGAGHYTVFRRLGSSGGGGCWVQASDESVHPASIQDVLHAEASMLVYEILSC